VTMATSIARKASGTPGAGTPNPGAAAAHA
jgi:hypothetical protein